MESAVERLSRLGLVAGKAVHDPAFGQLSHRRQAVVPRFAGVNHDRFPDFRRERELPVEDRPLHDGWREVEMIVEADLANSDELWMRGQGAGPGECFDSG